MRRYIEALLGEVPPGWEQHKDELRREREAAEAAAREEMEAARREEAELAAELRRERVELTLRLRSGQRAAAAAAAAGARPEVLAAHNADVTETRAAIESMLGPDEAAEGLAFEAEVG